MHHPAEVSHEASFASRSSISCRTLRPVERAPHRYALDDVFLLTHLLLAPTRLHFRRLQRLLQHGLLMTFIDLSQATPAPKHEVLSQVQSLTAQPQPSDFTEHIGSRIYLTYTVDLPLRLQGRSYNTKLKISPLAEDEQDYYGTLLSTRYCDHYLSTVSLGVTTGLCGIQLYVRPLSWSRRL